MIFLIETKNLKRINIISILIIGTLPQLLLRWIRIHFQKINITTDDIQFPIDSRDFLDEHLERNKAENIDQDLVVRGLQMIAVFEDVLKYKVESLQR